MHCVNIPMQKGATEPHLCNPVYQNSQQNNIDTAHIELDQHAREKHDSAIDIIYFLITYIVSQLRSLFLIYVKHYG